MNVKDLRPFSDCDFPGTKYNLPSRETLKTNIIQPTYEQTKLALKKLLAPSTDIAFTYNNWTTLQGGTRSYITFTCHLISENFQLHEFV